MNLTQSSRRLKSFTEKDYNILTHEIILKNAPQHVKELVLSIPDKQIEFIETTVEATKLADTDTKC